VRPPVEPGEGDRCRVTAYLNTLAVCEISDIFDKGWNEWNRAQGEDEKWTLAHGQFLRGTLNVTTFQAFNNCPDTGGLTIRASFAPGDGDPTKWYWCQALYDNYDVGVIPPHEGTEAARYEMDVSTDPLVWPPPLYPYQYWDGYKGYNDGHFYDQPQAHCRDDNTVFFHAVALMCNVNYATRTLTAYEGVSYGWDFQCVSYVPDPSSLQVLLIGCAMIVSLRRRLRN